MLGPDAINGAVMDGVVRHGGHPLVEKAIHFSDPAPFGGN
jgi:hypothetical protein